MHYSSTADVEKTRTAPGLRDRQMFQRRMFRIFDIFIGLLSKPRMSDNGVLNK